MRSWPSSFEFWNFWEYRERNLSGCRKRAMILNKTVGKVITFDVFFASLPSPLIQCCAKLNLLGNLATLNREGGGYIREGETISFAPQKKRVEIQLVRFIYITFPTTFVYDCSSLIRYIVEDVVSSPLSITAGMSFASPSQGQGTSPKEMTSGDQCINLGTLTSRD